jgi:ubiquinol-cytochrome c reductase iron-sulfur subunit
MSSSDPALERGAAPVDTDKRNALIVAAVVGGAGAVAAAVPFVASFAPSERAKAAGAPIEVDISGIAPGELRTVEWRGLPVWILRRTPEMLEQIRKVNGEVADPKSERTQYPTPAFARNEFRSRKPELLVAVGICTHLGCSPTGPFAPGTSAQLGADSGFVCPCHGSTFDLAGRVFKNKPAPDNLVVPPYKFAGDTLIVVGDDSDA